MESLLGPLYTEREMPERPKESFLTSLFGGAVRNIDREELCKLSQTFTSGFKIYFKILLFFLKILFVVGEAANPKSSRSVAKIIPGPNAPPGMEQAQMRAGTLGAEVAKTKMMMVERGQKLGQLEDRTEKMMNEAENFSSAAHQLMLKYKDKKWYQLWARRLSLYLTFTFHF